MGLDTTGPHCSVSIVDEARIAAHISVPMIRGHAEALAPMVAEALEAAGLSPKDIDKVAICTGPGSFTGLRVALSFAKGFALPRKLPVIGMDALEITAQMVRYRYDDHLIGVMRDIRREQVFYASYSHGAPIEPPRAMSLQDAEHAAGTLQATLYEAKADTRILAWLADDLSPADYPAEPLYSRGPDAKLPGKTPKAKTQHRVKHPS